MTTGLTNSEKEILLKAAREAITTVVNGKDLPVLDLDQYSPVLRADGASFVTLTRKENGQLRGCIGTLQPFQPLLEDVREHAVAAAFEDYRFPQVQAEELPYLSIEISRLTKPVTIAYDHPEDLRAIIRVGIDGVVLQDGSKRATFLPQVWEQIPDFDLFMGQLCQKMGAKRDLWQHKKIEIAVYQVEEFSE